VVRKSKATPPQISDLLRKVRACIQFDRWTFSVHAVARRKERKIDLQDITFVLQNGFHEEKKTVYDEHNKSWKYAIRGTTIDGDDLRIIVTFVTEDLFVITVIRVGAVKDAAKNSKKTSL